MINVARVTSAQLDAELPSLAKLRIAVFREYPYLYEGSFDYERRYLQSYASSTQSVLVVARDGSEVIGAATALPLLQHSDGVAPPLRAAGYDPAQVFYFGESVLLPSYRGRGIGHAFFDEREAAARELGFTITCFCAVERPTEHPARPASYVPHDAFWTRRGYQRRPDIIATFSWRDLGEASESAKKMVFWLKEHTP
jgi:GNAT superfamily N-acetyltransferase